MRGDFVNAGGVNFEKRSGVKTDDWHEGETPKLQLVSTLTRSPVNGIIYVHCLLNHGLSDWLIHWLITIISFIRIRRISVTYHTVCWNSWNHVHLCITSWDDMLDWLSAHVFTPSVTFFQIRPWFHLDCGGLPLSQLSHGIIHIHIQISHDLLMIGHDSEVIRRWKSLNDCITAIA